MVVMVIIGLMASAVVLTLPSDSNRVRGEGEALAARLVAARDLSIIGGRDIGVAIDAAGYGFSAQARGDWQPVAETALAPHAWPAGITANAAIEGDGALVFDSTGAATPAQIELRQDGAAALISVDGAGGVRIDAR
jgi:general secretion pathway protein H